MGWWERKEWRGGKGREGKRNKPTNKLCAGFCPNGVKPSRDLFSHLCENPFQHFSATLQELRKSSERAQLNHKMHQRRQERKAKGQVSSKFVRSAFTWTLKPEKQKTKIEEPQTSIHGKYRHKILEIRLETQRQKHRKEILYHNQVWCIPSMLMWLKMSKSVKVTPCCIKSTTVKISSSLTNKHLIKFISNP